MESCVSLTCVVKRLTYLALAGLGVVVLAGPILTVAALVGTFALIGFLVWLPLHTVFVGPQSTWKNACDGSRRWGRRVGGCCGMVGRNCRCVGTKVVEMAEGWWPLVGGAIREGLGGALVGILVVVLAGLHEAPAVAAVLAGAMVGIAVGLSNAAHRQQSPAD
jgi:hypothetical protein